MNAQELQEFAVAVAVAVEQEARKAPVEEFPRPRPIERDSRILKNSRENGAKSISSVQVVIAARAAVPSASFSMQCR